MAVEAALDPVVGREAWGFELALTLGALVPQRLREAAAA